MTLAVCAAMATAVRAAEKDNNIPKLAPIPPKMTAPENNPIAPAKVELGRLLFFDTRLSGDNTLSCATCHDPKQGFADGLPLGKGSGGAKLKRHTPTVLNVGLLPVFTWDGRAASLEEQALQPIQAADEMNQDLDELEKELSAAPEYLRQFQDVFAAPVSRDRIAKALAAYQRTLVTRKSPLDRYLAGDKDALSPLAQRGLEIFTNEANCIRCHNGPALSDGKFYRLGIGSNDEGRGGVTKRREDLYKFRTPPLRDVAKTAPYMHDGSLKTLEAVVEFYFRGVPTAPADDLPLDIEPLVGQSYSDIEALTAFLRALSGEL